MHLLKSWGQEKVSHMYFLSTSGELVGRYERIFPDPKMLEDALSSLSISMVKDNGAFWEKHSIVTGPWHT